MKVVTVALHHEVLTAWAEYRLTLDHSPQVWSLDFHTDVLCARRRGIALPETAAQAVNELHHDEHFDWALRAGVISRGVIGALAPCSVLPEHPGLTVLRHPGLPELDRMLNADSDFSALAATVLEDDFLCAVFGETLPPAGYILDIDCDYFMCEAALHPQKDRFWHALIARAGLITLSCENEWVKLLRLRGETLTGTAAAAELEKQINAVVAADL